MKIELDTIESRIDKALSSRPEVPRPHFGISGIGELCERKAWLKFRWAVLEQFEGRILRLFQRGHREEESIVRYLRMAGLEIKNTGWDQKKVDLGSHVMGSIDGIIVSGVPEAPEKPHILEIKTHSKKSFDDLERHGVEKSKPDHWAQMQGYMIGSGIDRALYVSVCKDDDRLYTERVRLDRTKAEALVIRARRIAASDRMPVPQSTDPTFYSCKWCPAHSFCFESHVTKEVNCRTCAHSTAEANGTWSCAIHGANIPVEFQREGCRSHVAHPDLVPWKELEGDGRTAKWEIDGKEVLNGEGGRDSRELLGPGALFGKVFGGDVEVVEWPVKKV